jgi:hypothetical protein
MRGSGTAPKQALENQEYCSLFADHMRVVLILADGFHQLLVRKEIEPRHVHCSGFGISSRIIDGDLKIDMPKVAAPQALGHLQCFRLRVSAIVQPALVIKTESLAEHRRLLEVDDRLQ